MIDNFDTIHSLLSFKENEFYVIQIVMRLKENRNMIIKDNVLIDHEGLVEQATPLSKASGLKKTFVRNRKSQRWENDGRVMTIMKTFFVYSHAEFLHRKQEIIEECKKHNARAWIFMKPRNIVNISYTVIKRASVLISQKSPESVEDVFVTTCEFYPEEQDTMIDIDKLHIDKLTMESILNIIEKLGSKILYTIPSKSGVHIFVDDILQEQLNTEVNKITSLDSHELPVVLKNCPTNLYIL